ncbi:hypothetical protein ZOSMA_12G00140 [Zostera marina]|uniref:DUF7054 domain-containing protein n=1 Tax=Zostera marina TaxID=29655 RepID=A0A0K9Q1J4_ZOSMR|nr:hypothetical protein ZOSMA_12G00140 [Zostera marina]
MMRSSTVNHSSHSWGGKVGQLTRPSSEPVLYKEETSDDAFDVSSLHRFSTYIDLPSSPHITKPPFLHRLSEGERKRGIYTEDSKVLVKVIVQKSPGPVKALVKLGTTIEEAVSTVIDEYRKEGRYPTLDDDDTDTALFQLDDSYFSNQALNKTYKLGDVGGRSFLLRKEEPYSGTCSSENQHYDDNRVSIFATTTVNP